MLDSCNTGDAVPITPLYARGEGAGELLVAVETS